MFGLLYLHGVSKAVVNKVVGRLGYKYRITEKVLPIDTYPIQWLVRDCQKNRGNNRRYGKPKDSQRNRTGKGEPEDYQRITSGQPSVQDYRRDASSSGVPAGCQRDCRPMTDLGTAGSGKLYKERRG